MTSQEEKKVPPPVEGSLGGVFPDEIDAIKEKAQGEKLRRRKIPLAAAGVLLVILAAVGGTLLVLHLNRKPTVVTRSVQLAVDNEIIEETVEVDRKQDTETFRTVSSNGTSYVIRDMERGLTAYRFDGNEKCYILEEGLEEAEDTEELLEDLKQMEEGEVGEAERRAESYLSLDEARGLVDRTELSDSMLEFCYGLQTHWAVMSGDEPEHPSTPAAEPTPTAAAEAEEHGEDHGDEPTPSLAAMLEEEASTAMDVDIIPTGNGTNAVHHRSKRSYCSCCRGCRGSCSCGERTETVCRRRCRRVCTRWGWLFRRGRCLRWETRYYWVCRTVTMSFCSCSWYG